MIRADERYTIAITTDNLKMDTRDHAPIGDVDVLTAAGWSRARIGSALLRLASEFDGAVRSSANTRTDAALFIGKLRTLPAVRLQLAWQLMQWGVDNSDDVAMGVLAWWLHKVCNKCHGRGYEVVSGTGRLSARQCDRCSGTGEKRLPNGENGRRAANFLDDCAQRARHQISNHLRVMTGR